MVGLHFDIVTNVVLHHAPQIFEGLQFYGYGTVKSSHVNKYCLVEKKTKGPVGYVTCGLRKYNGNFVRQIRSSLPMFVITLMNG